ncbi:YSIRK signal domain/LPXTG anchor domain surface protein [Streptococcus mitis]|uniref:YSIRK signal domain/LPXTG anchor domain surface protein n=1 Tax=Streptococcus mitis TaxID=28037 RepID=A0A2I1YZ19_STRMT|nr:G5 domain-containing protein [Streptococcus mitis]PLA60137.1 YSIRK signal domain/LPXTG anchor domain surface protein [Streptococcus mitis]
MKDIFNKRQRFSIRKFSVGVASVLIGIALFTPSQGVLASTENSLPSVEKREEVQPIPGNQNNTSSELDTRDVPIGSTRTTEPVRSGDKENNSLTTRDFVAGEDRSSTPAVRAASNPSEVKKYELTDEYAKQIKAGVIGSEGNKLDSLLLNGPQLSPESYTDNDYLKDKEELYIYEKDGKKYVGYNSHPLLEDTDGDGIIDSKEKPDEKLKWNVSERDMIMFMELSYRDDNYIDRVLDHKKPLTESELYKKNGDSRPRYEYMMMNKELGPYWERKKSYHTSSGLDAVLYETKSDFSYLPNGTAQVLAFRGTSDAKDIGADIRLGTGSNPQQGKDAENIMRELAKDKSITNLYLTGHSLGGYLVQRAMVEAYQLAYSDSRVMSPKEQQTYRNFYNNVLKKGTTFNAPKVVTSLVSGRDFWQKGLDSKKIAKSGKLTHYIVDNDSTIRKGVSNDSDVVINVGRTSGGHSSRSYFEADMINRRSEFISGKRISLDGTGYQDKKITTVKSVEKVGETAVYSKRGDDIIKSTTVSMKDPDTGQITKNTLDEVFKKDGAKSKVVVTPIQPSVRYEKDSTKAKGGSKVTVSGTPGTNTVTTTYTVNPTDGSLIPHEGQPVTIPSTPTVVKVPAKDEIEYLKEGDDVIKKTTSYQVDASTGDLTPTETTEIFKRNGAKSTVVVTPLEPSVRYEKDATRAKGEANVTTAGTPGTSTVTTTYTVNPTDGSLVSHEGQPVIKPSTPTVVKVPAKDEVEYLKEGDDVVKKTITYAVNASTGNLTPTETTEIFKRNGAKSKVIVTSIEPSVRYEKDATKAKGEANVTTAGTPGTSTVTTTYTVKPTDGRLIPHEGQPVTIPSTPTVVKVPAKDEVEYLKEGDDVVKKTTSYQVNASTGDLTPTVRKDIVSPNGAKSTVIVKQIEPSVRYEKDATRAKGEANVTTAGTLGTSTVTTTYTVNPADGSLIPHEGQPVIKSSTPTVVKVPAKDEVEYLKDGDDVVKKTTTYEVNASTGVLTPTVRKDIASPNGVKSKVVTKIIPVTTRYEADKTKDVGTNTVTNNGSEGKVVTTTSTLVNETNGTVTDGTPIVSRTEMVPKVVKVGAKDKVVETPIEPEVEYVKDVEKDFGTPDERTEGEKGKTVTTTTYDVDPTDGHITEHVGTPVVTPVGKTIVKVGAKTKVEQSKDPEGRDVIDTTTYEVDPKTGKVTPTTVRTYGTSKESTTETRPVPSPVVYEKDDSRDKDSEPVRKEGTPGEETITTTYTVDPKTGAITPTVGKPVRTKEPTNTVVKVGAKDKVVEMPIEPEVEYVKDVEKEFGTPDERTEGKKGKTVTTTTYDVDSNDGHITEHVDNPVVSPAGKTIVKVGAKTKVEQSKDSEGLDVIDTTTYEVDPKTGKVTPTTVRTYGTRKEPTVELEQNPKTGDVTVTPKKPDGSTYPPGTTVEIPVKGDKPITVTIGEDGKGKVPNSELPEGKVPGTGKITEPGKPSVEVPKVTIFENGVLPDSIELPELMIEVRWIDEAGNVLKPSLKTGSEKDTEHGSIPGYEFVRTMIAENEPVMTHIFSKVSGTPTPIPSTPPKVTAENGVLPDSIELPELMIEVRWIDESGNVLKPSLKTGNEKDAEHGSIPGYEFVRTVIAENEPAITYIFNKVSGTTNTIPVTPDTNEDSGQDTPELTTPTPVAPVTPDTNGNSGQDTPAPTIPTPATPVTADTNGGSGQDAPTPTPATPTPNAVTPNANQENTTDAIDNGVKSKDSQNVLPNTGTESNATLASLGLLGILGGLGLALGKKKED